MCQVIFLKKIFNLSLLLMFLSQCEWIAKELIPEILKEIKEKQAEISLNIGEWKWFGAGIKQATD